MHTAAGESALALVIAPIFFIQIQKIPACLGAAGLRELIRRRRRPTRLF
jgi:hypothetical protein